MSAADPALPLSETNGNTPDVADLQRQARKIIEQRARKADVALHSGVRPVASSVVPTAEAPTPQEDSDWRIALAPSGSGFIGDERNVLIALRSAPELDKLVRFNEFSLNVEFLRAPPWRDAEACAVWTEADDTQCTAWLQNTGLKVRGNTAVANCIHVAARDRPYHPVRDYLKSLTWDGGPRLRSWLVDYLNATGNVAYLAAIGARFLISAVARVMQPGCQADHVLTLESPQGTGKTTAARTLAVQPGWFAGDLPDIHGKDARLQLLGRWIIEIAELRAMRSADLEAQKSFLTQTHDTFRPPYGRRTAQFPRQSVFIATTNEQEYLRDRTGNRRWWPVKCGQIDVTALAGDRDQLWAEAVHHYRDGCPWHLTETEAALAVSEQHERVHITELEEDVATYLATLGSQREVVVRDVLVFGLRLDPDKPTYTDSARRLGPAVAEALERCGWMKDARRGRNKRTTYVRR